MVILPFNGNTVPDREELTPEQCERGALIERVLALRSDAAAERVKAYNGLRSVPDDVLKSVWATARPDDTIDGWERDCLQGLEVEVPSPPIVCARAVVSVVSPGYESYLRMMLDTLQRHGSSPEARVVVFAVDESYDNLADLTWVTRVRCRSVGRVGTMVKGAVYSCARFVQAETILFIEADLLVAATLQPLWALAEGSGDTSLLACAPQYVGAIKFTLAEYVAEAMSAPPGDFAQLGRGQVKAEDDVLAFNSGTFAGKWAAFDALESQFLALSPRAVAWCEGGTYMPYNEEMVMNLCAYFGCDMVAVAPAWNVQFYTANREEWVDTVPGASPPRYLKDGERVHILHFLTAQVKPLMAEFHRELMED